MKSIIALILAFSVITAEAKTKKTPAKLTKIRIGWQVPWAIQGQIVQIFKNTDILKKNGFEAEFVGKTAGPELNELAMGGQVDMILTADQPASALFMKSDKWEGVARLMYNRTSTYAPINSKLNAVTDLKDKQVGVPFGTAAQRIAAEAVEQNKVTGVKFVNLGMLEHAPLIKSNKDAEKWGDFDALSGFDPIPAILEANKLVKVLHKGKVCAMVVLNRDYISANPEAPKKFVKALKQAYEYYNKNMAKANDWFVAEAMLKDVGAEVFTIAAEYEPNFKKGEGIRTSFTEEDLDLIQKAADFVGKSTNKTIKIRDFVSNKYQQ